MAPRSWILFLLLCLHSGGPIVCALKPPDEAGDQRPIPALGGSRSTEGVSQPRPTSSPLPEAGSLLANRMEPSLLAETKEGFPNATSQPSTDETLHSEESLATRLEGQAVEEQQGSSETGEEEEEEEGRGCDGDVTLKKKHRIADAMMKFTADLLRVVEPEESGNLFFSPFSISLALAHLALGAANQTEVHLLEALHLESVPCLHRALHSISRELDNPLLTVAARLYLQKGFQVKEKFLEDSEKFYGAKPVALSGQNEADLIAINNWVKEATKGQISAILSQLPANAVMVLLNAVHFQGFWRNKFDPSLTAPGTFHLDQESIISVEMMKAQKYPLSWFASESPDVQVARFPFKGNTSLVVIVPNHFEKNVSQLLTELSKANFRSRFPKERPTMVKMPKLHFQHHMELNQALSQLGLGELFSTPDFSGMAELPLFVSSVQHRSALELAEAGVEASAATSVVMSRSLSTFTINQPFIMIIEDDLTGVPLFVGHIKNPDPSAPKLGKEKQNFPEETQEAHTAIPK